MNWREITAVPVGIWQRVLHEAGSPLEEEADRAWSAAGTHAGLCLAMLRVESRFGTAFNANKASNQNYLNLRPADGSGGHLAFDDPIDGIAAWRERLTDPTYKGGVYARTVTVADLIHVYAPSSDGNNEAAYVASIERDVTSWGVAPPKESVIMAKPKILVIAGHRSYGDSGNAEEKSLTPALARAYRDKFRAAGYQCTWLQEADGDADPDDTVGGLDTVSSKAAAWIAANPGQVLVFDLHYEGSPAPGMFAIIPDVTGLQTAVGVAQPASDTWENNVLDRQLGRAIVTEITKRTGLGQRAGIREQGLMDESQTGVGQQYRARLATFAYTAPYHERAVRLVIEHGNHTHPLDRQKIFTPDFAEKCADGAVAAVNRVFAETATPAPVEPHPITWQRGDVGRKKLGNADAVAFLIEAKVMKPTKVRRGAATSEPVITELKEGRDVVLVGSVRPGPKTWVLVELAPGKYGRALRSSFAPPVPVP